MATWLDCVRREQAAQERWVGFTPIVTGEGHLESLRRHEIDLYLFGEREVNDSEGRWRIDPDDLRFDVAVVAVTVRQFGSKEE